MVLLLHLESGYLWLIGASWRYQSLAWILRANIVVLKAIPALPASALSLRRLLVKRTVFVAIALVAFVIIIADKLDATDIP